jgi:hypothetical protein
VATSNRFAAYFWSAKNLAGCAGGVVGLVLHFLGVAGSYWPVVVAGLYAAGALLAPPEKKVSLVIDDTVAETGRLRADLDGLVARVREHRLPPEAAGRLEEITSMLAGVLDRADLLTASPDALYEITRAIRTDLPTSFEAYLNLPRWYAARRVVGQSTPSDELVDQLGLIAVSVSKTAGDVYAADAQRMRDHTTYLRDREHAGDLRLPPPGPGDEHPPST